MQKVPLGADEETYETRNSNYLNHAKTKYFKKGLQAGKVSFKRGELESNPYTIPPDVLELLRKRTLWDLGFQEGWAIGKQRKRKHKHKDKHEQLQHIEELSKKKHHHRKHKHHGKH